MSLKIKYFTLKEILKIYLILKLEVQEEVDKEIVKIIVN